MSIHGAEDVLAILGTLLGGLAIPFHRLDIVLRDALAEAVHVAQVALGQRVTLLSQGLLFFQRGTKVMSAMVGANPIATATENKRKNGAPGFEYHRSPIGGPSSMLMAPACPTCPSIKRALVSTVPCRQ